MLYVNTVMAMEQNVLTWKKLTGLDLKSFTMKHVPILDHVLNNRRDLLKGIVLKILCGKGVKTSNASARLACLYTSQSIVSFVLRLHSLPVIGFRLAPFLTSSLKDFESVLSCCNLSWNLRCFSESNQVAKIGPLPLIPCAVSLRDCSIGLFSFFRLLTGLLLQLFAASFPEKKLV